MAGNLESARAGASTTKRPQRFSKRRCDQYLKPWLWASRQPWSFSCWPTMWLKKPWARTTTSWPLGRAGDQHAGGLIGAGLGLGAGLLAFVVVEELPPEARDHAPERGDSFSQAGKRGGGSGASMNRASTRTSRSRATARAVSMGARAGRGVDGARALGGGQQGLRAGSGRRAGRRPRSGPTSRDTRSEVIRHLRDRAGSP